MDNLINIAPLIVFCVIFSSLAIILYRDGKEVKEHLKDIERDKKEIEESIAKKTDSYTSLKEENKKLKNELDQLKSNPDGTLQVLNDLTQNKKVVLEIRRVNPSEIFMRSPRGME